MAYYGSRTNGIDQSRVDKGEAHTETASTRSEERVGSDGAERRLEEMFSDHSSQLYRFALRLTGDSADAEDAVQEAFVRAARTLNSVPTDRDRAGAWLVRTLVNIERDRRRRARVRRQAQTEVAAINGRDLAAGIGAQMAWPIRDALATLPARRRAIIVLNAVEGRTVPEIASLLGIGQVTVRWHLMKARKALRPLLGEGRDE